MSPTTTPAAATAPYDETAATCADEGAMLAAEAAHVDDATEARDEAPTMNSDGVERIIPMLAAWKDLEELGRVESFRNSWPCVEMHNPPTVVHHLAAEVLHLLPAIHVRAPVNANLLAKKLRHDTDVVLTADLGDNDATSFEDRKTSFVAVVDKWHDHVVGAAFRCVHDQAAADALVAAVTTTGHVPSTLCLRLDDVQRPRVAFNAARVLQWLQQGHARCLELWCPSVVDAQGLADAIHGSHHVTSLSLHIDGAPVDEEAVHLALSLRPLHHLATIDVGLNRHTLSLLGQLDPATLSSLRIVSTNVDSGFFDLSDALVRFSSLQHVVVRRGMFHSFGTGTCTHLRSADLTFDVPNETVMPELSQWLATSTALTQLTLVFDRMRGCNRTALGAIARVLPQLVARGLEHLTLYTNLITVDDATKLGIALAKTYSHQPLHVSFPGLRFYNDASWIRILLAALGSCFNVKLSFHQDFFSQVDPEIDALVAQHGLIRPTVQDSTDLVHFKSPRLPQARAITIDASRGSFVTGVNVNAAAVALSELCGALASCSNVQMAALTHLLDQESADACLAAMAAHRLHVLEVSTDGRFVEPFDTVQIGSWLMEPDASGLRLEVDSVVDAPALAVAICTAPALTSLSLSMRDDSVQAALAASSMSLHRLTHLHLDATISTVGLLGKLTPRSVTSLRLTEHEEHLSVDVGPAISRFSALEYLEVSNCVLSGESFIDATCHRLRSAIISVRGDGAPQQLVQWLATSKFLKQLELRWDKNVQTDAYLNAVAGVLPLLMERGLQQLTLAPPCESSEDGFRAATDAVAYALTTGCNSRPLVVDLSSGPFGKSARTTLLTALAACSNVMIRFERYLAPAAKAAMDETAAQLGLRNLGFLSFKSPQ
ncbi:hypothetical protein SPRG_15923 [Saprolegnia parasitica CBS 223.65]|uniref:Uncharacterized protein n=1 Tax=Saprolegnia parasitica (strain CBS 223.65) TaxID=695850 RepID=A0A067BKT9_SAPPC|nr:hypothetical protein SPRG_15923 [Saprolegnia parasitica CBS 223.65]KDO18798.1 hypothetical protein SPRG_15923 [Saprolegnia parasitica CBS 223.65]|eukprot:XP_012210497.1 hypothetical protein SPRG_15923 [Saprolegnia parasitica CBS 223.65]